MSQNKRQQPKPRMTDAQLLEMIELSRVRSAAALAQLAATPLPRALRSAYLGPAALNRAAGVGSPKVKARKRPSLDAGAFFLPGERRACASATRGSMAGGAGEPARARRSLARSSNPASSVSAFGSAVTDSTQPKESRMNRKHHRARTPEESLHAALHAVAAQPAPANGERVTRRTSFRNAAASYDSPMLFSVNAGIPVFAAYSLAECLLCHVRSRFSDAVGAGGPIKGDEAYALELLMDVALSLYAAAGEHA